MRKTYKQKDIVVLDIFTIKRYIQQLAAYLGIFERKEISLFTKNIFDIFLVNRDDYSQMFWSYLEETLGDRLNNFDLTHIEIIADLLIQCTYDTFSNATGLDVSYKAIDISTDIGMFEVNKEVSLCLH